MRTLLLLMVLGAHAADAYYTDRGIQGPHWSEHDPLAQPFTHSRGAAAAWNGVNVGAVIAGTFALRRHRHAKIADVLQAVDAAGHTYGAAQTARRVK